ncbi:hypothetical protein EDC04DRAFT_2680954 [Pisolithus marmoratus]|nr:hypothetical protein EDC04DRAFT_2680954 [Pisolithus marmoratus]
MSTVWALVALISSFIIVDSTSVLSPLPIRESLCTRAGGLSCGIGHSEYGTGSSACTPGRSGTSAIVLLFVPVR